MNSKTKESILYIGNLDKENQNFQNKLNQSSSKFVFHYSETLFESFEVIENKPISLVLLDLNLPDSKGFRTLTSFLDKGLNLPVIVLSDTNNEIVGNQSIKAGAQDFLVKGNFDSRTLGRAIWYALQRFNSFSKLQKQVDQLLINEKRYEYGQEMARMGNWELDIVSNEMNWTEEVYRIFGIQPNSFVPSLSEYLNYVHVEDRETVENFFENASKDGQLHHVEHRILIDGHVLKHVAIRCKINFDNSSGKLMLLGVIQDITNNAINKQLIQQQNFTDRTAKVMQQALSDMSFNVRTPLSSIVNFTYLLENTNLSTQQSDFIDKLKVSLDDMSMVLNNLFNFAVLASEDLKVDNEDFKIKDFFKSNEKVSQLHSSGNNVALEFETDVKMPEKISVDAKKLSLVYYNLINYLSKDERGAKKVNVKTQVNSLMGDSGTLSMQFSKDSFRLSGVEIKELLDSEKLLQVYNPNSENQDNSTFNIAVTLKLIKLLSGQLSIENDASSATTFKVDIPVQIVETPSFTESDMPASSLKILLVEDHFLNQIATKKVLKSWSKWVSVDIAENGLIAVEKQREHQYNVIVMDIQMPVMDGIEASKKIREKSSIPIIALTANSSKQEQERCIKVGINQYLSKPFKPQELYEKIMQAMASQPLAQ